jgi:hypothetical protein
VWRKGANLFPTWNSLVRFEQIFFGKSYRLNITGSREKLMFWHSLFLIKRTPITEKLYFIQFYTHYTYACQKVKCKPDGNWNWRTFEIRTISWFIVLEIILRPKLKNRSRLNRQYEKKEKHIQYSVEWRYNKYILKYQYFDIKKRKGKVPVLN